MKRKRDELATITIKEYLLSKVPTSSPNSRLRFFGLDPWRCREIYIGKKLVYVDKIPTCLRKHNNSKLDAFCDWVLLYEQGGDISNIRNNVCDGFCFFRKGLFKRLYFHFQLLKLKLEKFFSCRKPC